MKTYDAIVIGSGATGGWAAKQLTEGGMDVLLLEAGRQLDPAKDYLEHAWPYDMRFRGFGKPNYFTERQNSSKRFNNEYVSHLYADDADVPYTTPKDKPFNWVRARQVGGRTIIWGRQCYRLSDYDFKAADHDGYGVNWPIRYADLKPYYDLVENFIGVSGRAEGWDAVPDGNFLPPMNFSCGEYAMKKVIDGYGDRIMTIGRTAILTQNHQGRVACHWCGHCGRGCHTGSYFSSPASTLPAAAATGKLTLQPNAVVYRILKGEDGKASGVGYIDALTNEALDVNAKIVMVCASSLESTRLLMLSGIGRSSDALGHYLMDHTIDCGAWGYLPRPQGGKVTEWDDKRANGIYVPRFRNLKEKRKDYIRGYGFQGEAATSMYPAHAHRVRGYGAGFKDEVRDEWLYRIRLWAFGEMLARKENHVRLNSDQTDRWGIPTLHVDCAYGDNEKAMMKDAVDTARETLEKVGAEITNINYDLSPPGTCIHEIGTARMGDSEESSVLNAYNEVWDTPNVFVTDGASFPSSGCANPTLTMMALTARACDHILERSKRREI